MDVHHFIEYLIFFNSLDFFFYFNEDNGKYLNVKNNIKTCRILFESERICAALYILYVKVNILIILCLLYFYQSYYEKKKLCIFFYKMKYI